MRTDCIIEKKIAIHFIITTTAMEYIHLLYNNISDGISHTTLMELLNYNVNSLIYEILAMCLKFKRMLNLEISLLFQVYCY